MTTRHRCSFAALVTMGLGVGPVGTVAFFLVLYNIGHLGLRIWGLETGWREVGSLRLASSPERMEEISRQAGWAKTFGLPSNTNAINVA